MTTRRKKPVNDSQVIEDLDLGEPKPQNRNDSRKKKKKRRRGSFTKKTQPSGFQWEIAAWCLFGGAIFGGSLFAWFFWG